jgi:hypothetical protein
LARDKRRGYSEHPRTPDPYEKVPKRTFDGRVKVWRRLLHKWDIDNAQEGRAESTTSDSTITMVARSETKTIENEINREERGGVKEGEGEGERQREGDGDGEEENGLSEDDDVL